MNQANHTSQPLSAAPAVLSLLVAALMAAASLAGLLAPALAYPNPEVRQSFQSNDVVNLAIGLPILLGAYLLARRGSLLGRLFWPGAFFYVIYNYAVYAVAMPLTVQCALGVTLVGLSAVAAYLLLADLAREPLPQKLAGHVPARLAGGILAGFGVLFFVWRGLVVIQTLSGQVQTPLGDWATMLVDCVISPAWVIGGVLLWRKRPLGYALGSGLFFQLSMLFVALLVYFALQPLLFTAPFPLADFIAIFSMGLVCFVPFGLLVRGVARASRAA